MQTITRSFQSARTLILLILVFGIASTGHAGPGGPPAPERLTGPPIIGAVTITPSLTGGILVTFVGQCAQIRDVAFLGSFPLPYADLTEAVLEGFRVPDGMTFPEVQGCYRATAGDLIIKAVTHFTKTGAATVADVVILGAVLR